MYLVSKQLFVFTWLENMWYQEIRFLEINLKILCCDWIRWFRMSLVVNLIDCGIRNHGTCKSLNECSAFISCSKCTEISSQKRNFHGSTLQHATFNGVAYSTRKEKKYSPDRVHCCPLKTDVITLRTFPLMLPTYTLHGHYTFEIKPSSSSPCYCCSYT